LCRFVVPPDVVADARRTLELFDYWFDRLSAWPLALAAQDGQEHLPITWELIAGVFIGGSSHWKMSSYATAIVKTAKAMSKWVHVGRVNEPQRFRHFQALGVNSMDGSGISQYSHQRIAIQDRNALPFQPLFAEGETRLSLAELSVD